MPFFSIIIPAYNLQKYILDTLTSIEAQTFSDFDVIIVDDGSTDGTAEVCRGWCESHPRFSLFRKENGGVSSARNMGLEKAEGEYIWFIDGDDYIHPDVLKCLKIIIDSSHNTDYVSFKYAYVDRKFTEFSFPSIGTDNVKNYLGNTKEEFGRMLAQTPYAACCICVRRESIGNLRFFPICTSEDALFALQLTFKSHSVVVWEEAPYYYYQRPGSFVNSSYSWRKFKDFVIYLEHITNMKGERNGWGDGYLAFKQYRSALPFLCRHVRMLPARQERKDGRMECRRLIEEHFRCFEKYTIWYMRLIYHTRSRFLTWIFLILRYDLRDYMLHSPILSNVWKWVR